MGLPKCIPWWHTVDDIRIMQMSCKSFPKISSKSVMFLKRRGCVFLILKQAWRQRHVWICKAHWEPCKFTHSKRDKKAPWTNCLATSQLYRISKHRVQNGVLPTRRVPLTLPRRVQEAWFVQAKNYSRLAASLGNEPKIEAWSAIIAYPSAENLHWTCIPNNTVNFNFSATRNNRTREKG